MPAQHFKMISNADNLEKIDLRWKVPERSPSLPSLICQCGLKWFPNTIRFPSKVGHDNQKMSFQGLRDKTTIHKISNS